MKLSEAIAVLETETALINHPRSLETLEALNLAVMCLQWRILLKSRLAFSYQGVLPGEDPE